MSIEYDVTKDIRFTAGEARGETKGIEKSKAKFVANLLTSTDFTDEKLLFLQM
jgi:hypothetical protein